MSDGEEDFYYSSDDADSVCSEAAEGLEDVPPESPFVCLTEDDISRRQEDAIREVAGVLSVPTDAAFLLLRHHHWDTSRLHDEWFADEERVRRAVGLTRGGDGGAPRPRGRLTCAICFEKWHAPEMRSAGCGHYYCRECWRGYIAASVGDGPGCLSLRCPDPSCSAAVLRELVNETAAERDRERYARFALRSYVEDNRKTKWCPSPDCGCAVELTGSDTYDVSCRCGFGFCWQCGEEAHRPVNCDTVAKWVLKNCSDSENMTWLLANSKPCPRCKRSIEKNHGCMHMTCSAPCRFQFCWLCLGAWAEHGEDTGGFYSCNRYEAAKAEGAYNEEEAQRNRAKESVERYRHFYDRWAANHESRQRAQEDVEKLNSIGLKRLGEAVGAPESRLQFVAQAWSQIVECRRVLKWSYAFGYYIDEHDAMKREFFEYLQGDAQSALERLHQCAELEAREFFAPQKEKDLSKYRLKLEHLTKVTRNYFDNLVQALETSF